MSTLIRHLAAGAAAGAAGTTALNAVTYLDMTIRGRPTSDTPQQTVEKLSSMTGITIPGDEEIRANRIAGLGPLTGLAAGVGSGLLLSLIAAAGRQPSAITEGLIAAAVAFVGSNAPMTALGVTDPRSWPPSAWISDLIPHLAFGIVTAATLRAMTQRRSAGL